jgi:hypothetical protein
MNKMHTIWEKKNMTIKHWRLLFILVAVLLNGRSNYAFERQADGIVIELKKQKPTDAGRMKIQVCAENILRVVATAEDFSSRPSLIIEKHDWDAVPFSVQEEGDTIRINR